MAFRKITVYDFKRFGMLALNSMFGNGKCCVCGNSTFNGRICLSCSEKLYNDSESSCCEKCRICGKSLVSENEICMSCREERILKSSDKVVPVFPYRLWAKTLLFEWKMQNQRSLSLFFAEICNSVIKKRISESIFIVPVPPRPGKIKSRGWDQIEELSEILRVKFGYKILKLLERTEKIQQKKLDRKSRLMSKGRIYKESKLLKRLCSENSLPEQVLLIDDVLTTGVTVETCCEILKNSGISKVDVLSLFVVD